VTEAIAPVTPVDSDLRDFPFMPLEIQRLRRSRAWLICKRKPHLAFYMINLWTAAWHDLPAGSLEDDDDVLADLALCDPEKWLTLREEVLRGWVKAADGRLYHPVVSEKVGDAWRGKQEHAYGKLVDRLRKENRKRAESGGLSVGIPTLEQWVRGEGREGFPPESVQPSTGIPAENALKGEGKGEGEGEGKGKGEEIPTAPAGAPPAPPAPPPPPSPGAAPKTWTPPDWLPAQQWADFVKHRKAMRGVPFTDAARDGVIRELAKFRGMGYDPGQLLETSVVRGWRTVFEPKGEQRHQVAAGTPYQQHRAARMAEAVPGLVGAANPQNIIDTEARDVTAPALG
jgi:Protein of unknown function (DUF1376)